MLECTQLSFRWRSYDIETDSFATGFFIPPGNERDILHWFLKKRGIGYG